MCRSANCGHRGAEERYGLFDGYEDAFWPDIDALLKCRDAVEKKNRVAEFGCHKRRTTRYKHIVPFPRSSSHLVPY